MKSLLFTLLLAFVGGLSALQAQVVPGEFSRQNSQGALYIKFQGDSIGVWSEIESKTVVITRNGVTESLQADSIIQRGDNYIIQTPSAQYYIDGFNCILTIQPPLYTASFDAQVIGCERTIVKCRLQNGKSYYVYVDTPSSGEAFRVEQQSNGYRRIWIGREALEADYLDGIAKY